MTDLHTTQAAATRSASGQPMNDPIKPAGGTTSPINATTSPTNATTSPTSVTGSPRRGSRSYGAASPVDHAFTAEGLAVTNNAAFRYKGGAGCTGMFTNFVVQYSTPQGGTATLTATDALGRHLAMSRISDDASPKLRRTVLRNMGDPLKDPAVLELGNVAGTVVVRSVCLKGY